MFDPVFLSRIQFAVTAAFHFIFPPISIGLVWVLVIFEWLAWKQKGDGYERLAKFFAELFALTFVVGVSTGIVMEFQFGMNWAGYSKFVGDIFGAPLAAEALSAFFLESFFLGLYIFGRRRLNRGTLWFSVLMVAVGATISAFWIIAANSWQQTPAGFVMRNGRAELVNFWTAVWNYSTAIRLSHTIAAALLTGTVMVSSLAAYWLLKNPEHQGGRQALQVVLPLSILFGLLLGYPTGDKHAQQVGRTQPEKLAAMEGIFETQTHAPLRFFGWPSPERGAMAFAINVPVDGVLSYLVTGKRDGEVRGLNSFAPEDRPPVLIPFFSFHFMVGLGLFLLLLAFAGNIQMWRGKLWHCRWLLQLTLWALPLPILSCEFGWMVAEVGRQPWIVYHMLRTSAGVSAGITAGQVWLSLILFTLVYSSVFALYVFLVRQKLVKAVKELS